MGSKRGSARGLPEGFYAVPDPDHPGRLTFWMVRAGSISDWPSGTRWRPVRPPYPPHLSGAERRTWNDDWYATRYFPWKDRLIEAIAANVEGAAARFRQEHPDVVLPPSAPRRSPAASRRPSAPSGAAQRTEFQSKLLEERLIAGALRRSRKTYQEIARVLGVSKPTAIRRVQEAEAMGNPGTQSVVLAALYQARIGAMESRLLGMCSEAGVAPEGPAREMLGQLRELRNALPGLLGAEGSR